MLDRLAREIPRFFSGSNVRLLAEAMGTTLTMTIIGLLFLGMWWHLARHPEHTIDTVTEAQLRRSLKFSLVSPVVYGSTILLAFVSPYLCLIVYAALSGYFARGPSARALLAARENVAHEAEPAPEGVEESDSG